MQESEECSQLNGKHQLMACSADVKYHKITQRMYYTLIINGRAKKT
jgi:hypothetical protein